MFILTLVTFSLWIILIRIATRDLSENTLLSTILDAITIVLVLLVDVTGMIDIRKYLFAAGSSDGPRRNPFYVGAEHWSFSF